MARREPIVWAARALWLALPAGLGWALGQALDGRSDPVAVVAAVGLWTLWTIGIVALFVPTTVSLTAARLLAPAGPAVAVAAAVGGASALAATVAAAHTAVTAALVFHADVGQRFARGSAYGDEARFPLRPPGWYAAGPVPLAWALLAACLGAGPLLLAARQWITGALLTLAGLVTVVPLGVRFHRLARRWLVLVPAGVVVHDHVALAETAMFPRASLAALRLAPAGTGATDLTAGALGLALEIDLTAPAPVAVNGAGRHPETVTATVAAVLVSPSRPGRVLDECRRRRFPVG